jgi:hypothetical protein
MDNTARVRLIEAAAVDELFSLMKSLSAGDAGTQKIPDIRAFPVLDLERFQTYNLESF